ncbi:urotensin II-related peptide isoform X2 [Takifugu flavidus]|uniref:Uncharacterized protein n=1 Tax=Takifugu flavidus TaxID=433684 RepID=A0A5C6N9Y7_9TELE|nr:urotensin II-related peptide isoform X2 [Takifugu flavidus]TWW64006.1 hypothetical protein D4764_03G0010140 [Takifugu flavidus]
MFHNLPVKVAVMLLILRTGVEAAPTERGFLKPHPPLSHSPASPAVSAAQNPSLYLKKWLLSSSPAADGTTASVGRWAAGTSSARSHPDSAGLGKRAQMLKMIAALEELQRAVNSTLSSRITVMSRASGRNSGRKNKASPAATGGVKPTTLAPAAGDSTADVTGQNLKKSQSKKTKRVCFWKYCSQN